MAAICRFAGKRVLNRILLSGNRQLLLARVVSFKACPYNPPVEEGYDKDNWALGRPLAPHLTIYSSEYTSVLSILHRITGAAVSGMVLLFCVVYPFIPCPILIFLENLAIPWWILFATKVIIAIPLSYHCVNGLRHLTWDLGKCLSLGQIWMTGMIMLACFATLAGFLIANAWPCEIM